MPEDDNEDGSSDFTCSCPECGGKKVSARTYNRHRPFRLTEDTRIYLEELRRLNVQQTLQVSRQSRRQPRREVRQQSREPENHSVDASGSAAEEDDADVEVANNGEDENDFELMVNLRMILAYLDSITELFQQGVAPEPENVRVEAANDDDDDFEQMVSL